MTIDNINIDDTLKNAATRAWEQDSQSWAKKHIELLEEIRITLNGYVFACVFHFESYASS